MNPKNQKNSAAAGEAGVNLDRHPPNYLRVCFFPPPAIVQFVHQSVGFWLSRHVLELLQYLNITHLLEFHKPSNNNTAGNVAHGNSKIMWLKWECSFVALNNLNKKDTTPHP